MRWRTDMPAIAMALFIIISSLVLQVSTNAVFQIKLDNFSNNLGKDSEGRCCNGYTDSNGICSDSCVTKFRVCLKVYQKVITPDTPCTFGETITPVLGGNNIDLTDAKDIITTSGYQLDSWQGTFSLIIEAWHEVNNTKYFREPVLISRLMTNGQLQVGSVWTVDEYRTQHSSLKYQYRVVCQDRYYGSTCTTFCKPRNDRFGHWNCDSQGRKLCLPGWKKLDEKDDYCSAPVCRDGCKEGYCDVPGECKCRVGYKGPVCDECIPYNGCGHGTCSKPWDCNCLEGWGGHLCKLDLNYCTNHKPCRNGAICRNTLPGSYSCECPNGFNGTNCEIINDSCATRPCKNGGTCLDTGNDSFVCQCPFGYTGGYCELSGQSCADRPCQNDARCTDTPSGFVCHCQPGFKGLMCDRPINDCESFPCKNGGSCIDQHTSFECKCPPGYTGNQCETNINDCDATPCLNGGRCIDAVNSYSCQCRDGFVGSICQTNVDDCVTNPCGDGGICIDEVNNFMCKCKPGWGGRYCNQNIPIPPSPCEINPCKRGTCREAPEFAGGYRCICPPGALGPRCTVEHDSLVQTEFENGEPMSAVQIVLIISFSIAVPALAAGSIVAIICMKRRRRLEDVKHDEEARRQNEQNMMHNAVNNKNFANKMIFNSLDYPKKPVNTQYQQQAPQVERIPPTYSPSKKSLVENTYSIVPTRSTKTLNTDVHQSQSLLRKDISRLSLASRLEKDLDAYTLSRNSPVESVKTCKTPDPHLSRTCSNSEVHLKRSSGTCSTQGNRNGSTNTLLSTCSPSTTCTTPSSVYVIEEHFDDDDFIATEV